MPQRSYQWTEFEEETDDDRSDYPDTDWLASRRQSKAEEYKGAVIKPEQGDSNIPDYYCVG